LGFAPSLVLVPVAALLNKHHMSAIALGTALFGVVAATRVSHVANMLSKAKS
jgi:hypothetical protein